MWVVRSNNKLFYFSLVHCNSKIFNIWRNIWNIQKFGKNIFPDIDKYPSSLFRSVKTIWWSETRYNKLAFWERFINICFSNHMTFANIFANWAILEKFKWSPLIPMCQLVIFVLSTISVFTWWRWFVSWLTVKPAFLLSELTVRVEISTLQSGTCWLTSFLNSAIDLKSPLK